MSTKINGYKLNIKSQDEFFSFVKEFKSVMDDVRNQYVYDKLLPMYIEDWLERATHDTEDRLYSFDSFSSVVESALRGVKRKVYEATQTDFKTEYDAEVSFTAFYHNGEYYAILYPDHMGIFVKAWEALPQVSKFAYWNNTDEPEGYTYEEWEQQGDLWDEILGNDGHNPASVQGVTYAPYQNLYMKFDVDTEKFVDESRFWLHWSMQKKARNMKLAKRTRLSVLREQLSVLLQYVVAYGCDYYQVSKVVDIVQKLKKLDKSYSYSSEAASIIINAHLSDGSLSDQSIAILRSHPDFNYVDGEIDQDRLYNALSMELPPEPKF